MVLFYTKSMNSSNSNVGYKRRPVYADCYIWFRAVAPSIERGWIESPSVGRGGPWFCIDLFLVRDFIRLQPVEKDVELSAI